jgi:hypothetical protein
MTGELSLRAGPVGYMAKSGHRGILKASCGRVSKNKSNIKSFPISKNKKLEFSTNHGEADLRHSTCLLTTPTRL